MWRAGADEARGERSGHDRRCMAEAARKMAEHAAGGTWAMTAITLVQAERIIDAAIARGAALNCRPLSVIVVEPGCKVKAFKKEDGSSMIRFEMALRQSLCGFVARPQLDAGARAGAGEADLHALPDRRERRADFPRGRRHADPRRRWRSHRRGRRHRRHRGSRRGACRSRHPCRRTENRRGLCRHGPAHWACRRQTSNEAP